MVKILIENRMYNLKDEDFNKFREIVRKNNKNDFNGALKQIEEIYPIKGYINPYNYQK